MYKQNMEDALTEVESALEESDGPFFMGREVSIVDVQFLSFLERVCASLLYFKGYAIRVPPGSEQKVAYPAINKWFDALEQKPSYQLTMSDHYTHCWDLPPQLGGCGPEPEGDLYRKAINGERSIDGAQGSWELPLQPHNGGIEKDWDWAGDEAAAKREAVERLSAHHVAIVKFAARGAGKKGMPPVMAPLADPNAVSSEAVQAGINSVFEIVSLALLDGVDKQDETMARLAKAMIEEGGQEYTDSILASIAYLRDRVGVPRDMKLPAARQLRAHLNWALGKILEARGS
jgi:glutathione S-transferase